MYRSCDIPERGKVNSSELNNIAHMGGEKKKKEKSWCKRHDSFSCNCQKKFRLF